MSGGVWRSLPRTDGIPVEVVVDGLPVRAYGGETVATLLLRLGHDHFGRHPGTDRPMAPWCLMGSCFGCLCTIDDRPGSQACLVPVSDGLTVRTGASAVAGSPDTPL